MVDDFGDPGTNQEENQEWQPADTGLGHEEYIGSYQPAAMQPLHPSPFEHQHQHPAQAPPPPHSIYDSPSDEFELGEYVFPPHQYFMHHDHNFHVPLPTTNNFRVGKQRPLRRRQSRQQLGSYSPQLQDHSNLQTFTQEDEVKPEQGGPVPSSGGGSVGGAPLAAPGGPGAATPVPSSVKAAARRPSRSRKKDESGISITPVARNKFSLEEDTRILHLRFDHQLSWALMADHFMPQRSEKSLQVHYSVSLKSQMPGWTRTWTEQEDNELMGLVSEHQRAMWSVIQKRFKTPNIPVTSFYARYHHLLRREYADTQDLVAQLKLNNQ